jgi:hypothetical protein
MKGNNNKKNVEFDILPFKFIYSTFLFFSFLFTVKLIKSNNETKIVNPIVIGMNDSGLAIPKNGKIMFKNKPKNINVDKLKHTEYKSVSALVKSCNLKILRIIMPGI